MACCGNNNVERKKWTDGATDRINRLRDQFFRNKPELDVFRALVYTRKPKQKIFRSAMPRRCWPT